MATAAQTPTRYSAWLIEWPASDNMVTRWWNPESGWMIDANKAIWFARQQDAESYRSQMRIGHAVVSTEHVFGLTLAALCSKHTRGDAVACGPGCIRIGYDAEGEMREGTG